MARDGITRRVAAALAEKSSVVVRAPQTQTPDFM